MTKVNKNNESNSIVRLNTNNEEQLKAYFIKVFKLSKTGEEFPVDLDEVWPLVYSGKNEAVRELTKSKNEDGNLRYVKYIDYQSISRLVQAGHTKSKKTIYKLSLSCMEWFIARKIRAVFDIYRAVTHKTISTFENYKNISDHQKRNVQIQNSKDVNAFKYFNGGVEDLIEYNRNNCKKHTGKTPSEWKKIGKEKGLKSKECTSGKEVVRHLQPEAACGMSFVDNMVKQGYPMEKAIELSQKHAMPLFKGMIEMGMIPEELNQ